MLRILWTCKVKNEQVCCKVGNSTDLYQIIQIKKLKYSGHFVRQRTLQRTLLEGKVNGRRGRGRSMATRYNYTSQWTALKYAEAVRATYHRDEWRSIACNPLSEDGTTCLINQASKIIGFSKPDL